MKVPAFLYSEGCSHSTGWLWLAVQLCIPLLHTTQPQARKQWLDSTAEFTWWHADCGVELLKCACRYMSHNLFIYSSECVSRIFMFWSMNWLKNYKWSAAKFNVSSDSQNNMCLYWFDYKYDIGSLIHHLKYKFRLVAVGKLYLRLWPISRSSCQWLFVHTSYCTILWNVANPPSGCLPQTSGPHTLKKITCSTKPFLAFERESSI